MPLVDILIFAAIALFLIFRLRSILGSRDGFEQPNPRQQQAEAQQSQDGENVIELASKKQSDKMRASGSGLAAVKRLDPTFDENQFQQGAAAAFPMILTAYAEGDLATLRRLLGYELLEDFSAAIHARNAAGEMLRLTLDDLKDVQLLDGEVSDGLASVTVQFTSVQSRDVLDSDGNQIVDDSMSGEEMIDIWVFERDVDAQDPNWKLVETRTQES